MQITGFCRDHRFIKGEPMIDQVSELFETHRRVMSVGSDSGFVFPPSFILQIHRQIKVEEVDEGADANCFHLAEDRPVKPHRFRIDLTAGIGD